MFFKNKKNLKNFQSKFKETTENFIDRLSAIEENANIIFKKQKKIENIFHQIDTLISDKNSDLKLQFANHSTCKIMYGLPVVCSDLILNRYEHDVINDYIEKTGKWNSFIECESFSIDEIVKRSLIEETFIQIGYIDNKRIILKTNIKPQFTSENEFDGIVSVGTVLTDEIFNKMIDEGKLGLLYDKNQYTVFQCV